MINKNNMETKNYIKKDVIMIIMICLILGVCFALLTIYDAKTGQLTIWAHNFYNFLLQK
jgi:hypothetical protein